MAQELQRIETYYSMEMAAGMDYGEHRQRVREQQAMAKDMGAAIQKSATQQSIMLATVGGFLDNRIQRSSEEIQKSMVRMQTGIQTSIKAQTYAVVASQTALAKTFGAGFDKMNSTLDMGFAGISNQLGSMTSAFSAGFERLEAALGKMTEEICNRLDNIHDIVNNPLLTQSRELYRRAVVNYNKGFFEEALEDLKVAVEKNKTDYISLFLMGKIYLFGVSQFGNAIDLFKAVDVLALAAKYIGVDINTSLEARSLATEIWFHAGLASYNVSNAIRSGKAEGDFEYALQTALTLFEFSCKLSDNMLEALFNVARCKILMGNTEGALANLETLILRDRNYCLRVFDDSDFDSIHEDFTRLIEGLKKDEFAKSKDYYTQVNDILTEINSLNGTLTKQQEEMLFTSMSTEPTGDEPYFDVMDNAQDYQGLTHIFTPVLDNLRGSGRRKHGKTKNRRSLKRNSAGLRKIL